MELKLGVKAKDLTTGFKGTVTQRLDQLNGNVQYALTPESIDGAYPEGMFIDQHLLEAFDAHLSDRVTEVTYKVDFVLGNEVQDKVSGFKGIATERGVYMNGCESYSIIPKYNPKSPLLSDARPPASWISATTLKYVGPGVVEIVKPPPVASTGLRPGGPGQRVSRPAARRSA